MRRARAVVTTLLFALSLLPLTAAAQAQLTSPPPGSTLAGSTVAFSWTMVAGAQQYALQVGSAAGGADVFVGSGGTGTSLTVGGIPLDGRMLFVRLWTRVGGMWAFNSYTYRAASPGKAAMISPAPGSMLGASVQTFAWTTVAGAQEYWLQIGSAMLTVDIFSRSGGTGSSLTVNGIPLNGRTLFVRLWTRVGTMWAFNDYTYDTADHGKAAMTNPAQGSTLGGLTETFRWRAGVGAQQYWLQVGSAPGASDVFTGSGGMGTSLTVSGIPVDGRAIFVRLWTLVGGMWVFNGYTYTAGMSPITLQSVVSGLTAPLGVVHAGDARLFVVQKGGQIVVVEGTVVRAPAFLDIASLIVSAGEQGLLGLAFHPSYATNGLFYVCYTEPGGTVVIARYSRSTSNPDLADPLSGQVLLRIPHPTFTNHNGGHLAFGPDGYLYASIGDGGGGGDPSNNAQNLGTLLGKLLRIDVDGAFPYAIPVDNPFVGIPGVRGEIWAFGLRNPWQFSFDRLTGDVFIGDVGQGMREEIDFQPASSPGGENYGWRRMEGSACFNPMAGCNNGTLVLPILEYSHAAGDCSVTGGFRYRGGAIPALSGVYLFSDFCTGRLWGAGQHFSGAWASALLMDTTLGVSSFGEDQAGELYVTDLNGGLYRIVSRTP